MESGIKDATEIDMSDGAIEEQVVDCRQLLDLRNVQSGAAANDFAGKLEQVRWAEIYSILLCHSLQHDISKYKAREAEAQAMLADFDEWEWWCELGTKATRALALKARQILVYSRLRWQVCYDRVLAYKANVDKGGLPIYKEDRAILSTFSFKPEYHISRDAGHDAPGEDEEDGEEIAGLLPGKPGEPGEEEREQDENETEGESDGEQNDIYEEEYRIDENLDLWEGESAADALESHMSRYSL
ncbi:hypothetical protein E8E11_005460 [Didymella keratinophila]|nr:hypothetical protein E8E11_005460 [Didymella keratinophila]